MTVKKKIIKSVTRRNRLIRIHKEGRTILIILFIFLLCVNLIFHFWSPFRVGYMVNLAISAAAFGFFLYFFRSPHRVSTLSDNSLVIAPADGRIVVIEDVEESEFFDHKKMKQISIFMSPFNVHANWYPINGTVIYTKHHAGRHKAAYLPKSSFENERASTVIESETGHRILLRQIAGALARRIVTYAAVNHKATLNNHLGFIKFGSRVDIFLPVDAEVFVNLNENTKGNETIIARLPDL